MGTHGLNLMHEEEYLRLLTVSLVLWVAEKVDAIGGFSCKPRNPRVDLWSIIR